MQKYILKSLPNRSENNFLLRFTNKILPLFIQYEHHGYVSSLFCALPSIFIYSAVLQSRDGSSIVS